MNMQIAKEMGIPEGIREAISSAIKDGFANQINGVMVNGKFTYACKNISILGEELKVLLISIPYEFLEREFVYMFNVKDNDLLSFAMHKTEEKFEMEEKVEWMHYLLDSISSIIEHTSIAHAQTQSAIKNGELN